MELLRPGVEFDKADPEERLAKTCILILPGDFEEGLPLENENRGLWRWFFTDGFQTIFRNVTVVESLDEPERLPVSDIIVSPELLSWDLGAIPQGPSDQTLWHCRMKFKLQLYNMKGVKTSELVIDKIGWGRNRIEALSDAMRGFMNKARSKFGDVSL